MTEEFELVPNQDSMPLEIIERAQIDMQISTAKKFPRSVGKFKQTLIGMATLDEETAESCMYAVPRAGKTIQGESVRLIEMAISAWGNLRVGTRIVGSNGKTVTAQAICHDLEANTCITIEKQRRITDKNGNTFSEDMIIMTANAAASIALRDAVQRIIPKAYIRPAYEAARNLALGVGGVTTLVQRRNGALDYFKKMGISEERILAVIGKQKSDDIGIEELERLTGYKSAIKSGDTTVDEVFPMLNQPVNLKPKSEQSKPAPTQPAPVESSPTVKTDPKAGVELREAFRKRLVEHGITGDEFMAWCKKHRKGSELANNLDELLLSIHGRILNGMDLEAIDREIHETEYAPTPSSVPIGDIPQSSTSPLGELKPETESFLAVIKEDGATEGQLLQWMSLSGNGEFTDVREIPIGKIAELTKSVKWLKSQLALI